MSAQCWDGSAFQTITINTDLGAAGLPCETTLQLSSTELLSVQSALTGNIFPTLTIVDGGLIGGSILFVWAVAFGIRAVADVINASSTEKDI